MANSHPMVQLLQNELDAARNRIRALDEQNQAAAAEIASFRHQNAGNTFITPEGSAPLYWVRPPPYNTHPGYQHLVRPPAHNPTMPSVFQPVVRTTDSSQGNEFLNSGFTHQIVGETDSNDPVIRRLNMLEEQNKRILNILAKLPGAAVPVDVEPRTGYQASPFIDTIALMDIPNKYNIPAFVPKYSGVTDPTEHVAQYKQLMWTVSIPQPYQETCMCKSFGATLTGAALQWLINLKPKTIGSFAELINQFSQQFASSRKMEKQTSDLYYVVQKDAETIRDYFNRFNTEMINIRNCDVKTAIEAYKRGLDGTSGLYMDLTKHPPENFEDIRARTLAYMRVEDDFAFRRNHSNDQKSP